MSFQSRGRGDWPEPEPKPFSKVVITRGKDSEHAPGHDRFHRDTVTGKLTCRIKAMTPLHVGSGIYELDKNENPVRGQMRIDGRPIIPGSSLKGAIRSIAEAISYSCVRITRSDISRRMAIDGVRPCDLVTPKKHTKLCVCCRIFGALGYQGRVSFTDARLMNGDVSTHAILPPYPPRDSARGYKDVQKRFNGRKFYYHGVPASLSTGDPYEVITQGSTLEFAVQFESLGHAELCLVLVAMGILDNVMIKLGGGKQAMLGSVQITPARFEWQVEDSFKEFGGGTEEIKDNVGQVLLERFGNDNDLINEDALDDLMNVWKWPSDRKAPTGVY